MKGKEPNGSAFEEELKAQMLLVGSVLKKDESLSKMLNELSVDLPEEQRETLFSNIKLLGVLMLTASKKDNLGNTVVSPYMEILGEAMYKDLQQIYS